MPKIYTLRLNWKLAEEHFLRLLEETSVEARHRVLSFHHKEDAYRSLFGEFLARYAIILQTGLSNEDIILSTTHYGKPYIEGMEGIHFNISHAGNWVVCALDNSPVGIDVEQVMPVDIEEFSDHFSAEEYALLSAEAGERQLGLFYELWTLKEAYIKQQGKGMSIPLNAFSVSGLTEGRPYLAIEGKKAGGIFLLQYEIDENYKMAVCAAGEEFGDAVQVSEEEIEKLCI
jgi:4'-phosphopantetheinyl transferase